uniref:Uncharacterized protein n=1 Tax=Mycena chlorophos TaxID=658473 RepID=A0ABQ0LB67_MYCCL|nr:predicted protein [Mycena chlorophos]
MAEVKMWKGYEENGASFSAGAWVEGAPMGHDELARKAEVFGMLDPEGAARRLGFGEGSLMEEITMRDEEDDFLSQLMANAGLEEPTDAEIQAGGTALPRPSVEYFPYPNKTLFLLDLLDNLPRLRVSSSLMRVILWVMQEAGARDVPSLDALHKLQKQIRPQSGVPSIPCVSPLGNVFFMNDPRTIVAHDWANPSIRQHIHVYPEIPSDGIISEIWHAQKWRKDLDLDALSPMYDAGPRGHFYVNELAKIVDGPFVVPIRWVIWKTAVYAESFLATIDSSGNATIDNSKTKLVEAQKLEMNYLELRNTNRLPTWSSAEATTTLLSRMPNPKRAIAGGHPLYSSFVDYFGDDVSGNRSKSWNKHWNAYMTNRGLPRKMLQQEFHVHFVSTSPHASITEQYREFKAAIVSTHTEPVIVQDEHGQVTKICIYCNAGPSDNPMQSEVSSHIGGKGNFLCRKCKVGGTSAHKCTNTGYHELFESGVPRTKEYVLQELQTQVRLVCGGRSSDQLKNGTQRETGVKDAYTQHWIVGLEKRYAQLRLADPDRDGREIKGELMKWSEENEEKIYSSFLTTPAFDPTVDTPIELLHTILLGAVKYVWHVSHMSWSAADKKTYSHRLQATNCDGLSIQAIRANYIMQYANSLIGKQLKTIVQTAIFHVHDIVSNDFLVAWRALGELSALLWVPEIRNLKDYQSDLRVAVANLLDAISVIDPSKIITKMKYHLLVHSPDDATRFSPLIGMMTELFESFNAIFRYCSILSNHLAPSRDIASQLGNQEGLKHCLTGGYWAPSDDAKWVRARSGVRHFLEKHTVLQKLLGWTPHTSAKTGDTKLAPIPRGEKTRTARSLRDTTAAQAARYGDYSPDSKWDVCKSVLAQSLDECLVESWVFAEIPSESTATLVNAGRIVEILKNAEQTVVVLDIFELSLTRDDHYGMPVLTRPSEGTRRTIISASNFVEHQSVDRYILNIHSFHNPHLIRATLPRHLWAPIPLFSDRKAKHDEFAQCLRDKKAAKKNKGSEAATEDPNLVGGVQHSGGEGGNAAGTTASRGRGAGRSRGRGGGRGRGGRQKRQREDVDGSEEEIARPSKRARRAKNAPTDKQQTAIAVTVAAAISGEPSLAAGRSRRTIRQTERARIAEEQANESSSDEGVATRDSDVEGDDEDAAYGGEVDDEDLDC